MMRKVEFYQALLYVACIQGVKSSTILCRLDSPPKHEHHKETSEDRRRIVPVPDRHPSQSVILQPRFPAFITRRD